MPEDNIQQVMRRAKEEPAFRAQLINNPRQALQEYNLPEEVMLSFVLPNFSWLVPQQVAGSGRPSTEEAFASLKALGITALLTLTEQPLPPQLLEKYALQAEHLPIADYTAPTIAQVVQTMATLNRLVAQGEQVAVHCAAGLGRTGTILACYLVSLGTGAQQAIVTLRERRPGSIETREQEQIVTDYEAYLIAQDATIY